MRPLGGTEPFVAWLRAKMRQRRWTAAEVGERVGVSHSTVSRWIHGTRPTAQVVLAVAEVFGTDPDDLLALTGYRRRTPAQDSTDLADLFAQVRAADLTPEQLGYLRVLVEAMARHNRPSGPADDPAALRPSSV